MRIWWAILVFSSKYRRNWKDVFVCEKKVLKYEKVLEKFGDEVDKHNERHGKGVRFKNYSVSIVLKESEQKTKNVQEQELSLIEYTQRNLEKIIARRQKVQNKILCKRLQKI